MDSLGKRVAFLNDVIGRLGLNAEAMHIRAEEAARLPVCRDRFDRVTARAVAALPALLELALPLARPGGLFIAYKGPSLDEELAACAAVLKRLNAGGAACYPVPIPGHDWDHRLCAVKKAGPTPKAFPRRSGEAARNPILR